MNNAPKPGSSGGLTLSTTTTTTTEPSGSTSTTSRAVPRPRLRHGPVPAGKLLGSAAEVPDNQSAAFTIPSNGEPGIVIHTDSGDFVAYNAVCPHMGCTVGYSSANKIMVCPCHGSEFEVSNGDVIVGPAPHGLTKLKVVEGTNGNLYLQ